MDRSRRRSSMLGQALTAVEWGHRMWQGVLMMDLIMVLEDMNIVDYAVM